MTKNSLKFFYANMRSLLKEGKMDELKCNIKSFKYTVHLILLTETWIKSEKDACTLKIPNYTHFYNLRTDSIGGGVSIYIHNDLTHSITEEKYIDGNNYLWIYLSKYALHIGLVYKPPATNTENFLQTYSEQLENRKRSIVFGDFNINLLNNDKFSKKYNNILQQTGYEILNKIDVNYCTRETETTKTIIDHVCTNIKKDFHLAIIDSPLSDHKQIYCELKIYKKEPKKKYSYEAINYNLLYRDMCVTNFSNAEHDFSVLENYIKTQIDNHKTIKYKIQNLPQEDWINKNIIEEISKRNQLWRDLKHDRNNTDLNNDFIWTRNHVGTLIKNTKDRYYFAAFMKTYNKPRRMWNKCSVVPSKLIIDGKTIDELQDICESFNIYFSSIGPILANNIPQKYHKITSFITHTQQHPYSLNEFKLSSKIEIQTIINNLNVNSSSGIDNITTKSLKCINNLVCEDLSHCINKCIKEGVFPDSLKIAKVSPIHKSGGKTDPGNYRPISVLPALSKVFEKIIHVRLNNYLKNIDFLYKQQYGFRKNSNTLSATIDLVNKIKNNIDQKKLVLGVFIDLKKAFDTVSHNILINKLTNIGIHGSALKLLTSCLTNRQQIVKIKNIKSTPKMITCGIPQGSILGPLLFLIYINDISHLDLSGEVSLYADDTCLFYFEDSIEILLAKAQNDLDKLHEWFQYNLLTINIEKTSFMLFHAKNKKIPKFNPIMINNQTIKQSNEEKYLGLILDPKLTWQAHLDYLQGKINSLTGAIRRSSRCIPHKIRIIIYNSLVKSLLEYLVEIWGSAYKTNIKDLQISQNKLLKSLFHLDYHMSTKELYKRTNVLSINQLYKFKTCILIRKILTKTIHTQITFRTKTYKHYTRNKHKLELPKTRTKYGIKSLQFEGAKLYNSLPNEIFNEKSFTIFKKKLLSYCKNT
ncbi:uncharacterized protein LOC124539974 [Vanessa cardui]|uniref:uncharacterized protein LOC124539974 n=1 Tax=Vanessa cardui TaxID=171605 RepID=UPI001F14970A|nr:uncharacterized protein LOC124539974 [Vanessa cardui]